jgi:hypothetical protein
MDVGKGDGMTRRILCLAAVLGLAVAVSCPAQLGPAPFAVGFAVGVPYGLPVDWSGSFSVLSAEAFLSRNLTVGFDLGTYPASFPDLYEGSVSLHVKGWLGAASFFAGGGLTGRWHHVGSAWALVPHLNLRAGVQAWVLESLAIVFQARSVEPLPVVWTLTPEISLGVAVAIGRATPSTPVADVATLWILVGLGVAALIAFLPRS